MSVGPPVRPRAGHLGMRFGWLGLFSGLLHCAPSARPIQEPPAPAVSSPLAVPAAAEEPRGDPPAEETVPPPAPAADLPRLLPALESFYQTLDALRSGQRTKPVRVLWLGDSHTAADFMTHQVRQRLVEVGGDGGPGFVRLGMDGYRHDGLAVERSGKWRKEPILPAQRTRVLDGVFGYGGIRTVPLAGGEARLSLVGVPVETPVSFSLSYRLPPGASLRVQLGSVERVLRSSDEVALGQVPPGGTGEPVEDDTPDTPGEPPPSPVEIERTAPAGILQVTFWGEGRDVLRVSHVAGKPEIFGVYVENGQPGVVLDTVGINGARAATPLAWEPSQFHHQLAHRAPDLVVLAFGTNEAFDKGRTETYREQVTALLALIREAVPQIPCWILGPPDASDEAGGSRARVAEITRQQALAAEGAGCAFSSGQALMGGPGSFVRWEKQRPPLARSDGIHLTVAGYRELGARIADALLLPKGDESVALPP